MLPRMRTPPKPEQADDNPSRSDHGAIQPVFRRDMRASRGDHLAMLRLVHVAIDENAGYDAEQHADADGEERQPRLRDAERVRRALEDVGEGGEENEQDAEGEGVVEREEEHCGLGCVRLPLITGTGMGNAYLSAEHVQRSYDLERNRGLDFRRSRVGGRDDAVLLRAPSEDDGFVRFSHRQGDEEGGKGDEDHAPLRPLPALVLRCEAADDGSTHTHALVHQVKNPEKMGTNPKAGPANGAARNILVATARWRGGNRSAFVPAPTASGGLPLTPAKKRQMARL